MVLPYPDRIPIAITPTPLEPLARLSKRHGVELLIKRDDLTGAALTGNKVRKLEFLLAEAQAQGADTVITCGGAQSNHCRATAIAARRLGLDSLLLLRVPDPENPPATDGNILLDRLVGAELRWVTPAEYAERTKVFARVAEELRAQSRHPYVIPEGGSNALGAWGYVRCVEELARDLPPGKATLVYAAGSGGTGAGLVLGVKLCGLDWRVVGINVCDDRDYFIRVIGELCEEAIARFDLRIPFRREELEIIDGYVGEGYAKSRPAELRRIAEVARTEGILLDPVYTGKAFHGLAEELARDRHRFGERVVFLHTGGIFGLFPKAQEIAPLL
ncbi:MAG: D-cysteine desulfhydrase family protein [Myxococcales bacterium]|nr:D-cysteine desulfhydrase family protein [Myxococcales bacterium]